MKANRGQDESMATLEKWLSKLTKLRVDRASGDPAPHKPLLLLTILEMAERNELPTELLPLTPELAFQFYSYWDIVAYRLHCILYVSGNKPDQPHRSNDRLRQHSPLRRKHVSHSKQLNNLLCGISCFAV